jgi:hypothetical protein
VFGSPAPAARGSGPRPFEPLEQGAQQGGEGLLLLRGERRRQGPFVREVVGRDAVDEIEALGGELAEQAARGTRTVLDQLRL